ncbi:MAG TPA: AAA family ATPase, partial [Roseiarcus sp.]|nr:AAA family ATPase [Roseiarcus sp.]
MAIISICSPKGGVGKTTAATLIATTLAERGAGVIVIDADPNKSVVDWARLPGVPANLKVLESTDENEIVRMIDASAAEADFV